METYQEFLDRIGSFEKRDVNYGNQYFKGNPSILQKVAKDNTFRDFYGDTIVFLLDESVRKQLEEYVELLYRAVPECFCRRLGSNTFHVTLHDLSNSPVLQNIAEEIFNNELKVVEIAREIKKYENTKIKMKSKYIFNMVDTSLVLGLYPADGEEYKRLLELYSVFEKVKKLDYPFTPHITLAYYNVDGFDLKSARILEDTVYRLNGRAMEMELEINNLYYQKFKKMDDYINIINLVTANK